MRSRGRAWGFAVDNRGSWYCALRLKSYMSSSRLQTTIESGCSAGAALEESVYGISNQFPIFVGLCICLECLSSASSVGLEQYRKVWVVHWTDLQCRVCERCDFLCILQSGVKAPGGQAKAEYSDGPSSSMAFPRVINSPSFVTFPSLPYSP